MVTREVFIDNEAKSQLRKIFSYIERDSFQNAEKVRSAMIASFKALANNPEQFPADRYRRNNDGSFRAYEIFRYRVTYHISKERITIIRIRHTKRDFFEY
jgi:plasmid stabilization system protein ParE